MERTKGKPLSVQITRRVTEDVKEEPTLKGNIEKMVSTGSTLLDLAISGTRIRGGGVPSGIMVEIFGPSGAGKTVLLCEIAGAIQRNKGDIIFYDPEARLNKQFARMFDLDTEAISYSNPSTVTEVFQSIASWEPTSSKHINGVITDSLAALSTEMEMEKEDGDKMGMRRAKEFSEGLRKICRFLPDRNIIMVCSNQVRINVDAGPYAQKYISPGGEAIGFYSSLRLRMHGTVKIKQEEKVAGKPVKRTIGVTSQVEVFKSSVDKPYRMAPVTILFDYGIDDIRENLSFIKQHTSNTTYTINGEKLAVSLEKSIQIVEHEGRELELKNEVIDLWTEVESKFDSDRKKKKR